MEITRIFIIKVTLFCYRHVIRTSYLYFKCFLSFFRKALFALHQKYVMKAGGYLVNDLDRKLSLLDSPATPKEVNNNLDADEMFKGEESKVEIICEIAPSVTYAGEGLEKLVKGQRFRIPCNLPL